MIIFLQSSTVLPCFNPRDAKTALNSSTVIYPSPFWSKTLNASLMSSSSSRSSMMDWYNSPNSSMSKQPSPLTSIFSIICMSSLSGMKMPKFCDLNHVKYYLAFGLCYKAITSTLNMAEATQPNAELLEWSQKDRRRFLHAVYRVGDLDRSIKFYTECFGMKLLRKRDVPEEKYTNAFLGYGPEESQFSLELTYNYGVTSYDIGTGFGHFALATPDVYKFAEDIRAKGGKITREPGPVLGGLAVIGFAEDPDGYSFELIQRDSTPEPICQVMLNVSDLERSIKFYEKVLGMKLVRKLDRPGRLTAAMLGYAEEEKTTVLELIYNYGVTEYTKGNAYAQLAIGTDDVCKSAEVVNLVTQELGKKITRQPGPIPGLNTKIASFLDPDGWKIVLVDNEDFRKELKQ